MALRFDQIHGGVVLRAETIKDRHSDIFTFLQGDLAGCEAEPFGGYFDTPGARLAVSGRGKDECR